VRFEVSTRGPVTGNTEPPGDERLTLSLMAFGALCREPPALINPSSSPRVRAFRRFLQESGVEFRDVQDGFEMRGGVQDDDCTVGPEVPDSIVHCVVGGMVGAGRRVTMTLGTPERKNLAGYLGDVLGRGGLPKERIREDEGEITFEGGEPPRSSGVTVRSAWALETVCAAAMASRSPLTVTFPYQSVSHSLNLLSLLGYGDSGGEGERNREAELTRRMSKAEGGPALETRRLEWRGNGARSVDIPGDTFLAAAVAGTAAVIQKSDVTIGNVLWERGRRGFFDSLRRMKGNVSCVQRRRNGSFDSADIHVRWNRLEGIHVTPAQAALMVGELLLLPATAVFAEGETVVSDVVHMPGIGRNAFTALARGLEMLGAHVGDYSDGCVVKGGRELRGDLVDSCGIPDVALGLVMAGLNSSGTTSIFGCDGGGYPVGEFLGLLGGLS